MLLNRCIENCILNQNCIFRVNGKKSHFAKNITLNELNFTTLSLWGTLSEYDPQNYPLYIWMSGQLMATSSSSFPESKNSTLKIFMGTNSEYLISNLVLSASWLRISSAGMVLKPFWKLIKNDHSEIFQNADHGYVNGNHLQSPWCSGHLGYHQNPTLTSFNGFPQIF